MTTTKFSVILLAAGQGRRMESNVPKQFLKIKEYPVLYYSLDAFEKNPQITEVILVTSESEIEYCKSNIVEKYSFNKVTKIVSGGKERYHSVYEGLCALSQPDYVIIHDGARPFIDQDILQRTMESVVEHKAVVVGMPVKDTIKIADENGFAVKTPNRELVWQVQTPQAFEYDLIRTSYDILMASDITNVTDDAMVIETIKGIKVKLIHGSYRNIKITTPEDLLIANAFISESK